MLFLAIFILTFDVLNVFSKIEKEVGIHLRINQNALYIYSKERPNPFANLFLTSPKLSHVYVRKIARAFAELPISKKLEVAQSFSQNVIRLTLIKNPVSGFRTLKFKEFLEKCAYLSSWYIARGFWGADPRVIYVAFLSGLEGKTGEKTTEHYVFFERKLRVQDFQAGGMLALLCLLEVEKKIREIRFENEIKYIDTPWGEIILGTEKDDIFVLSKYTLGVIDPGGNDIYIFQFKNSDILKNLKEIEIKEYENRTVAFWHKKITDIVGSPFFLAIDIQGNDTWSFSSTFIFPFKSFVVLEKEGDDVVKCEFGCAGAGFFSTGVWIDEKGNDRYISKKFSQGAGAFGTGLLIDFDGNDRYYTFTQSQGFGFVQGSGILIDYRGDDTYEADDRKIIFPSFQSKKHNSSMSQGCGFGLRGDFSYGDSKGGGVGILLDFSGNDRYSAGVFSQGCGFWYGVGILYDSSGDDRYKGFWYCQGSSAHFGAGIFIDEKGNDSFECTNQGIGHGHDVGVGVFWDFSGNDTYLCGMMCLGAGHANGLGIFFDVRGDDSYNWRKEPPGFSIISIFRKKMYLREAFQTISVFVDAKGKDIYKGKTHWKETEGFFPSNSTKIIFKNEKSEISIFWDME